MNVKKKNLALAAVAGLMMAAPASAMDGHGKTVKITKGECWGVNSCGGKYKGKKWDCGGYGVSDMNEKECQAAAKEKGKEFSTEEFKKGKNVYWAAMTKDKMQKLGQKKAEKMKMKMNK